MIELFLLETSVANPDPQVLEELGWRLVWDEAISARVRLGQQLLGRLTALDQRRRFWAFQPAAGANARGEVAVLVDRSTYFDRLWLSPSLLAYFWERLVGGGSRFPSTHLVYTREHAFGKHWWELPGETDSESNRTVITVNDGSTNIRRAGGPLVASSTWPLPVALAAVKVQSSAGYLYLNDAGYVRVSSKDLGEDVPGLVAVYSRFTALIEARLEQVAARVRAERAERVERVGVGTATGPPPAAVTGAGSGVGAGIRSGAETGARAGATEAAPDPELGDDEDEGVGQVRRRGLPLTLLFSEPLPASTLTAFLDWLDQGGGSLRLWGRARRTGEQRWQLRALDLHLRREVELELSPRQLVFVWPPGTCGNSLHRAVTHLLHLLDPQAKVFVGNRRYEELLRDSDSH